MNVLPDNYVHRIIPLVAFVLKFVIVFPWIHHILDAVKCKPYGTLGLFTLTCKCIDIYAGEDCKSCKVDTYKGKCSGTAAICKDKWMGPLCAQCHTKSYDPNASIPVCTGDCKVPWYNNDNTGKCRYCSANITCNAHGTCNNETGICDCSPGFALSTNNGVDHPQCAAECINNCTNTTQGTCSTNGYCKCKGSFCGESCNITTAIPPTTTTPCNGHGYPGFYANSSCSLGPVPSKDECKCNCFTDIVCNSIYAGQYCEHQCPMGLGGRVCGKKIGGGFGEPVFVDSTGARRTSPTDPSVVKCQCDCGTGRLQDNACTPYCCNGGEEVGNSALCKCAGNGDPYDRCCSCLPGYFFPETGCGQFCQDRVTCPFSVCVPSASGTTVTCSKCAGNRKPDIVSYTQKRVLKPIVNTMNQTYTLQISGDLLALDETRSLQILTKSTQSTLYMQSEQSYGALVVQSDGSFYLQLSPTDSLLPFGYNLTVPSGTNEKEYNLTMPLNMSQRVPVAVADGRYHFQIMPYVNMSEISNPGEVCRTLEACVAYNKDYLFSEICNPGSSRCVIDQFRGVTAYAPAVLLASNTVYSASLTDNLRRGCHDCLLDWYPSADPLELKPNTEPCEKYCEPVHTCNNRGLCDSQGDCVCNYPNMDAKCNKCMSGYYPDPNVESISSACPSYDNEQQCLKDGFMCSWNSITSLCSHVCNTWDGNSTTCTSKGCSWDAATGCSNPKLTPCSRYCNPQEFKYYDEPVPANINVTNQSQISGCSGHGFCSVRGTCECRDPTMELNGWGPPTGKPPGSSCDVPCNNNGHKSVCSGHGKCVNDKCVCDYDGGWFGSECDVTCNATDQYVYYDSSEQDRVPCRFPSSDGNSSCAVNVPCGSTTCTKLRCNGAKCMPYYDYQHEVYLSPENSTCGTHTNKTACESSLCKWNPLNHMCYKTSNAATIAYKICTSLDSPAPLLECTGLTNDTYQKDGWSKHRVQSELGIFCDVNTDIQNAGDTWQEQYGLCARVQCNCNAPSDQHSGDLVASQVYEWKDSEYKTTSLPISSQLAGRACNYAGCSMSTFDGYSEQSPCGTFPPQIVESPLTLLYSGSSLAEGNITLTEATASKTVFCSRGQCGPPRDGTYELIPGSESYPADPDYLGTIGTCLCKQTPTSSSQCKSHVGAGFAECCNGFYAQDSDDVDAAPFYGESCGEQCSCYNRDYARGSCVYGVQSQLVLGTACSCRASTWSPEGGTNFNFARSRLFCGGTCRYQCAGIQSSDPAASNKPFDESMCPAKYAQFATATITEGCYDDLQPCSGHGECFNARTGTCTSTTDTSTQVAKCTCAGNAINIGPLSGSADSGELFIPDEVVLYGGDGCDYMCPGVNDKDVASAGDSTSVWDFTNQHYDLLRAPVTFKNATPMDLLNTYASKYSRLVCSGHGYCYSGSNTYTNAGSKLLECKCLDSWGGSTCSMQCSILANEQWPSNVSAPYQELGRANLTDDILGDQFDLDVCGPHAKCVFGPNEPECEAQTYGSSNTTNYAPGLYIDAESYMSKLAKQLTEQSTVDTAALQRFAEQWRLAFVGPAVKCKNNYYSQSIDPAYYSIANKVSNLPELIKWQLSRSCDAEYAYNTPNGTGPWCCQYEYTGSPYDPFKDESSDEFNLPDRGGCPEGQCLLFAEGKSCRQCVSDSFEEGSDGTTCPSSSDDVAAADGSARCHMCKEQPNNFFVSPYKSYSKDAHYTTDASKKASCQACFSNAYATTGSQTPENRAGPCNGHGTCIGHMSAQEPAYNGTSFLDCCSSSGTPSASLGLCECDEGYTGPTCALANNSQGCNGHGTQINGICNCNPGHCGVYCEISDDGGVCSGQMFPQQFIKGNGPNAKAVLCNGGTQNSDSTCQCTSSDLDPDKYCLEVRQSAADTYAASVVQNYKCSSGPSKCQASGS